jgi:DNA-binding GntR family transcriptional regulator
MGRLLTPLRAGSVKSQVFNILRSAIFSGKLEPGQALRELELARELKVSQATVREALFELEHTGLVTRAPNKGTYVTKFSETEIRERLSIRVILEGLAAIEAGRKMTEENFRELERRVGALSKAMAKRQYYEFTQADLEFHRYIWVCSGNKTLSQTLDQLCAPLFAFVSVRRSRQKEDLSQAQSHDVIVDAIRQGNPDKIQEEIRLHIERSYQKSAPETGDLGLRS